MSSESETSALSACPRCARPLAGTPPDGLGAALCPACGLEVGSAASSGALAPTRAAVTPAPRPGGTEVATPGGLAPTVASDADGPALVPDRIDRYEVEALIGRGGMGVVYRARDPRLDRTVAIKVVEFASGPDAHRRFEREAASIARLRHPSIVAVHEIGTYQGRSFLVMDHVAAGNLELHVAGGRVSPRRAAEIAKQVASALAHAHEHGIVHRDVKPENILLDADGRACLADFGLAREIAGSDRITRTGQVMGTPGFMAPEQLAGSFGPVGPAVDIYALGGVLHRVLAGEPPHGGGDVVALMRRIIGEDVPPLRQRVPSIHPDLETIVGRCLERQPSRRYASASDLAADLGRFLEGEVIAARPIGRGERAKRWARRHPIPSAVAVTAVAMLLVAGVFVVDARSRVRRDLVRTARTEAATAWAEFQAAIDEDAGPDRALGLGLEAVRRAATVEALVGDDGARAASHRALLAYGRVAGEAGQFRLAASCFESAAALGIDVAEARAAGEEVEAAERAIEEGHLGAIRAIVERARAGDLQRQAAYGDALFELLARPRPLVARLLARELDRVSEELRAVARDVLIGAREPTPDERRGGEVAIDGLPGAIQQLLDHPPHEPVDESTARTIHAAVRRLEARSGRPGSTVPRIASRQESIVGPEKVQLARLCCEALGRVRIADEATLGALARHLRAEWDENRAVAAGIALCRIGGAEAERILAGTLRHRFEGNGPFRHRVVLELPRLARVGDDAGEQSVAALVAASHDWTDKRRFDLALRDANAAIGRDPESATAWNARGRAHRFAGRPNDAIEDFGRAIRLAPTNTTFWINRGTMRYDAGDPDGMADLQRAVALGSRDAKLYASLGVIHSSEKRWADAIGAYDVALEIDPSNQLALINRGLAKARAGDPSAGIADCSAAIAVDPDYATSYAFRAACHTQAGDHARAAQDYGRALEKDPSLHAARVERAVSRWELGDLEGAELDLRTVLERAPANAPGVDRARALLPQLRARRRHDAPR